jgi:hypothetical protein
MLNADDFGFEEYGLGGMGGWEDEKVKITVS